MFSTNQVALSRLWLPRTYFKKNQVSLSRLWLLHVSSCLILTLVVQHMFSTNPDSEWLAQIKFPCLNSACPGHVFKKNQVALSRLWLLQRVIVYALGCTWAGSTKCLC